MQMTYFYLNIIAIVILIVLGMFSYQNREEPYATTFLLAVFFLGGWILSSSVELLASGFELKLFARNITQITMALAASFTYWFVIKYGGYKNWIFKGVFWLYNLLTLIYVPILFTDQKHHMLRSNVETIEGSGWKELIITSTPFGTFTVLLRFFMFGLATILLFVYFSRTYKNMKKQVIMITIGYVMALVLLLLKQYWLSAKGIYIPMSVILIFPYIFVGIGIFRFEFLTVAPFAKEWIINSLEDGVLMVSKDGTIVEKNEAAHKFIERYMDIVEDQEIKEKLAGEKDFVHEMVMDQEADPKYYQFRGHHLFTERNKKRGSVIVIKDITDQKKQEQVLIHRADYDGLTQVLNKQALKKEFQFIDSDYISMMVIDIDHFKGVNDNYGHQAGDEILVRTVNAMKRSIRKIDVIGRVGGDEFCIVMKDCDKKLCETIADRILEIIRVNEYDVSEKVESVTVSIGGCANVKVGTLEFEKIFEKADEALYEAKKRGRNTAVIK